MSEAAQYYQCRLTRLVIDNEVATTTGWIEARGAKVGVRVELLPSRQIWEVAEVYDHSMPLTLLKDHQRMNRHSLPSIEAIQ
jgi:hypothetical protein